MQAVNKMLRWMVLALMGAISFPSIAFNQDRSPSTERVAALGLREVRGKHLRLVTDLPIDTEIESLPAVFDQAMHQWKTFFGVPHADVEDWSAIAALIKDKNRFVQLGLLTSEVPDFKEGFQAGSRLFVMEQPSPYYRRHLLLHEGTHWFMYKTFGGAGPTWFMEGMAEVAGTHSWDGMSLQLGIVPQQAEAVPYWGRTKIIKESRKAGTMPSLESVMRIKGSARMEVESYAWCWAVATFFRNHPVGKEGLAKVLANKLDYSNKLNAELQDSMPKSDWNRLKAEWEGFVAEVDYGYDLERSMPLLSRELHRLDSNARQVQVRADKGWQSTGVLISRGDRVTFNAVGQYTVAKGVRAWVAEPSGITLRYVKGYPLGMLLACVATKAQVDQVAATAWKAQPVGLGATLEFDVDGELMLQINDSPSDRADNDGTCQVTLR